MNASDAESDIGRRVHEREAEIDTFLRSHVLPGETVVAVQRHGAMVTDRRALFAWPGYPSGWRFDVVALDEVIRWSLGHRHDTRPLIRMEHPTHLRAERVAARHFLWFAWGNAEVEVAHDDTTLSFGTERDPAFRALVAHLEHLDIPRGEDFVVSMPGTREQRTRRSVAVFRRARD